MLNDTISILFDSFSQKDTRVSSLQCQHFAFVWKFIFYFQTLIKRHIDSVWILGLLSQWRKTPWKPRGMHSNAFNRVSFCSSRIYPFWLVAQTVSDVICYLSELQNKGSFSLSNWQGKELKNLYFCHMHCIFYLDDV